ncbi:MAG TPA: prolyl aminopeptidase [Azospirillaceae bacterium]|nr:prolyl aminopeptidase [Azospirillaceae bacterium]
MTLDEILYPEIEPYETGFLAVDGTHTLYWEQSGNPDGVPVLFLHGGPGAGVMPMQRRTFDPAFYRIVLFDQRGCGKSTPHGELKDNTTQHLVADIEALRRHLGIDRWLVTGGSWGSFLSLAYSQAHPDRVLGLRLHGIFLARRHEIDWWFHGIGNLFPEAWAEFGNAVPAHERGDLLRAYYTRLIDPDPAVHLPAAVALRTYSARTQTFLPDAAWVEAQVKPPEKALPLSRLFTHYCVNGAFLAPGALLAGVDRIRHIPGIIVQGRYDVVTPATTAYDLHQAWPEASFRIVTESNHVVSAPALARGLVEATDEFKARLAR